MEGYNRVTVKQQNDLKKIIMNYYSNNQEPEREEPPACGWRIAD